MPYILEIKENGHIYRTNGTTNPYDPGLCKSCDYQDRCYIIKRLRNESLSCGVISSVQACTNYENESGVVEKRLFTDLV